MTDEADAIAASLREFICAELAYEPEEVGDDTALFSTGMVDSFTFVGMVALIESRLDRDLDPRAITVENFDSIARIVRFLRTQADDTGARGSVG